MVDRNAEDQAAPDDSADPERGGDGGADRWIELDRAREAILEADEHASGSIHEQLESLEAGIFEEEGGGHTRSESGPKVDRVVEVAEKLDALAGKADEPEVGDRIRDARDHLRQYLKDHPQGG